MELSQYKIEEDLFEQLQMQQQHWHLRSQETESQIAGTQFPLQSEVGFLWECSRSLSFYGDPDEGLSVQLIQALKTVPIRED